MIMILNISALQIDESKWAIGPLTILYHNQLPAPGIFDLASDTLGGSGLKSSFLVFMKLVVVLA